MSSVAKDRRFRKRNFTEGEKVLLFQEIKRHKDILLPDVTVHPRAPHGEKEKTWHAITKVLNQRDPLTQRTTRNVKKKWRNMIYQIKVKYQQSKDAEEAQLYDGAEEMDLSGLDKEIAQFLRGRDDDIQFDSWMEDHAEAQDTLEEVEEVLVAPDSPPDYKWSLQQQIEAVRQSAYHSRDAHPAPHAEGNANTVQQNVSAVTQKIVARTFTPPVMPIATQTVSPILLAGPPTCTLTDADMEMPHPQTLPHTIPHTLPQTQEATMPMNGKRSVGVIEPQVEGLDEEEFERQKRVLQIKKMKLENKLLSKQLEKATLEVEIMKGRLESQM